MHSYYEFILINSDLRQTNYRGLGVFAVLFVVVVIAFFLEHQKMQGQKHNFKTLSDHNYDAKRQQQQKERQIPPTTPVSQLFEKYFDIQWLLKPHVEMPCKYLFFFLFSIIEYIITQKLVFFFANGIIVKN